MSHFQKYLTLLEYFLIGKWTEYIKRKKETPKGHPKAHMKYTKGAKREIQENKQKKKNQNNEHIKKKI